jgi:hypothetical protein
MWSFQGALLFLQEQAIELYCEQAESCSHPFAISSTVTYLNYVNDGIWRKTEPENCC